MNGANGNKKLKQSLIISINMTKRTSILTFLALFAATLTQQGGAWAQGSGTTDDWGQVKTATSEWTHITAGSNEGFELKDEYYYVSEDLTFTNPKTAVISPSRGSAMQVQAGKTVHLYIPAGVTLTAIGSDADELLGGGAGILVPEGSTLYVIGNGTLVAKGGNGANGIKGGDGTPGVLDDESVGTWFLGQKIYAGVGGEGGHGGGGAGAGIGTAGGDGGRGGETIGLEDDRRPQSYTDWEGGDVAGLPGQDGNAGTTASAMGTVYIASTINQQISGGAKGNGGACGIPGNVSTTGGELVFDGIEFYHGFPIPQFDITDMQAVAGGGGGGGGAGGGGGEAYSVGTGGCGGGGGGSGAAGNTTYTHFSGTANKYHDAGAKGGSGGKNGDGTSADGGASVQLTHPHDAADRASNLRDSRSGYDGWDGGWDDNNQWHDGGAGGGCGRPRPG